MVLGLFFFRFRLFVGGRVRFGLSLDLVFDRGVGFGVGYIRI